MPDTQLDFDLPLTHRSIGTSRKRLLYDPDDLENTFAREWEKENSRDWNDGPLEAILRQDAFGRVTPRDAVVAATVVQWLGTSCGQGFLHAVLQKHNMHISYGHPRSEYIEDSEDDILQQVGPGEEI